MTHVTRRSFLQFCKALSTGTLFSSFARPGHDQRLLHAMAAAGDKTPEQLAGDEDFWYYIQQSYMTSTMFTDLNSAGMASAPQTVHEHMKRYADLSNDTPSYIMRRYVDLGKEPLRLNLARLAGVSAGEIAIQRNASEALETIIFGLPLQRGDEVVLSKQDYPNVINAWKQRELREGIKLVWVNLVLPSEDNEYLAGAYTKAFTAKTKLVHITHMINWNGQILPVRKIADVAHKQGIEVMVDGAQSFAQIQFTIPELGADYFGASLHKWLSASIGSGMLYIKKEKIKTVFPLFAASDPHSEDIRKFEQFGTHPSFIEQSVNKAIEFYEMIGARRKEQRLLYLKNYWMNKVKDIPGIELGTSLKPGFGCAIGLIKGKKTADMDAYLVANYRLHTLPIDWENIKGIRVSPNVFTTIQKLDLLVEGIAAFAKIS